MSDIRKYINLVESAQTGETTYVWVNGKDKTYNGEMVIVPKDSQLTVGSGRFGSKKTVKAGVYKITDFFKKLDIDQHSAGFGGYTDWPVFPVSVGSDLQIKPDGSAVIPPVNASTTRSFPMTKQLVDLLISKKYLITGAEADALWG